MKRLIVAAPGISHTVRKHWQSLIDRLEEDEIFKKETTTWLPLEHNKTYLSSGRAMQLANEFRAKISTQDILYGPYDEILLIGHSIGGALLRQAYLLAATDYPDYPAHDDKWHKSVRRFVLFAATNRGVNLDAKLYLRFARWLLSLRVFRSLLLTDFLIGSPFITDLRIRWIRHWSDLGADAPVVIQVLGTRDRIVHRIDSIDVTQFPNARYVDVPGADHGDLHRLDVLTNVEDVNERYEILRRAIFDKLVAKESEHPQLGTFQKTVVNILRFPRNCLKNFHWIVRSNGDTRDLAISSEQRIRSFRQFLNFFRRQTESDKCPNKTLVVFVLHGIRASNSGWVAQVESRIKKKYPNATVLTGSYGWFSALDFAWPGLRRKNLAWFLDHYSYYFATYPKAEFHFIGHSNGTYLLGEGLKAVPSMRFNRVVLTGSVLPCDYPWRERFDNKQIQDKLRNDRANNDVPVGILCSALNGLGMKDIGMAGVYGFNVDDARTDEVFYYTNGHGAAVEEKNLDSLVEYVLTGKIDEERIKRLHRNQVSYRFRSISNMATDLRLLIIGLLMLIIGLYLLVLQYGFFSGLIMIVIGILIVIICLSRAL